MRAATRSVFAAIAPDRRAVPSSLADPEEKPMATDAEEIFPQIARWKSQGQGVALATVVQTWGSSPRAEGSHLAVNDRGEFVGSV
jgi:hypothetical protein